MNRGSNSNHGRDWHPDYGRSNGERLPRNSRDDYYYNQSINSASNRGGHAYGQNYGQEFQGSAWPDDDRNNYPRSGRDAEYDQRYDDRDTEEDFYYRQAGAYGNPYEEQRSNRHAPYPGEEERWYDEERRRNMNDYRRDDYQSSGQNQGFGHRIRNDRDGRNRW